MLDRIFSMDSPLVKFIFLVKDLFVINLLTIVFMLPIFTIGPALKALAFTCLKIVRQEDGNVPATYIKNFKLNFKQTVGFGMIVLVLLLVVTGDVIALLVYRNVFPPILIVPAIIAMVLVIGLLCYAVPMQGRFLNPVKVTFRNAFWAMLAKAPKTLLMVLCWLFLPALDLFVSANFWPVLILFGLSLPAYLNALIYEPFFREVENMIKDGEKKAAAEPEDKPEA